MVGHASRVLELAKAESALESRCHVFQANSGEVVERGSREHAIREQAAEARLKQLASTLETEVSGLRSESSGRNAASLKGCPSCEVSLRPPCKVAIQATVHSLPRREP